MRSVVLDGHVENVSAEDAFSAISRFERFADYAPHVQSAVVHQGWPEPIGRSSWELHFRSGLLSWTEEERFVLADNVIEFHQTSGDFDVFVGRWTFTPTDSGTLVHFEVDFDFGIASLESILDPIAERVIKETVAWTVVGMFDTVRLDGDSSVPPTPVVDGAH